MYCKNCGNLIEEKQNICNCCGVNIITNTNPTKKHEIVVKIVNCILLSIHGYMTMLISGGILILLFILGIASTKNPDINLNKVFEIFAQLKWIAWILSFIILIIFNIIMGTIMYKINKHTISVGKFKKINKKKYALLTFYLGILGINRFAIGDVKGGLSRIGINIVGTLIVILLCHIDASFILFLIIPSFITYGLVFSDFVIGLSKVSDENKMISL